MLSTLPKICLSLAELWFHLLPYMSQKLPVRFLRPAYLRPRLAWIMAITNYSHAQPRVSVIRTA